MIGTVDSTAIAEGKAAEGLNMQAECVMTEDDDVKTVELFCGFGRMFKPRPGTRIVIYRESGSYLIGVAEDDGIEPNISDGEQRFYSLDENGEIAADLYFNADGELVLNGGEDYAVKYNELETAFNQLKSDFDSLVNAFNAFLVHTHAVSGTAAKAATGFSSGSPSTADISPAKVEKVRV